MRQRSRVQRLEQDLEPPTTGQAQALVFLCAYPVLENLHTGQLTRAQPLHKIVFHATA